MASPAAIIEKIETGYRGISCNWDGYPSHVGKILKGFYQDPQKVKELMALGEISSLGERINPIGPHSHSDPEDGTTVAYHRDRGERLNSAREFKTFDEIKDYFDCQYVYLFDKSWKLC